MFDLSTYAYLQLARGVRGRFGSQVYRLELLTCLQVFFFVTLFLGLLILTIIGHTFVLVVGIECVEVVSFLVFALSISALRRHLADQSRIILPPHRLLHSPHLACHFYHLMRDPPLPLALPAASLDARTLRPSCQQPRWILLVTI